MSFRAQFRAPAWASIQPKMPDHTPADKEIADNILNCFKMPEGQVLRLCMDRKDAAFYRIKNAANNDLFVRIEGLAGQDHHSKTEGVARWLNVHGVTSNACFENFPTPFGDNQLLYAFPYIDGRYLEPTIDDMHDLGEAVSKLHTTLNHHPDVDIFKAETHEWITMIANMRTRIQDGHKAGTNSDRLQKIAQDCDLDFVMSDATSCACHGDLHSGNIMRNNQTNDIIFFDFEDVTHSVLPPIFEIARIIERIILIADLDDQEKIDAGHVFITAYRKTAQFEGDLLTTLKSHNLRSLCLLAVMEEDGVTIAESEWNKFFTLFDAAENAKDVLMAMEAA